MSILGKNGEELTNFDVHLQHLYQAPNALMLKLVITQGTYHQSLFITYDQLELIDIQRLIPGCVYLTKGAKSNVVKQIRLSLTQMLQAETQVGTLYTESGWHNGAAGKLFVAGGAVISEKGIAAPANDLISERVAQLHLAVDNACTPVQSCEQLLQELNRYGNYGIPVFSYTLYAMLHSVWPIVNLPAACVLNLIGTQGYGKTTLARNFCALYNHSPGQIADFYDAHSTQASMRDALSEARDRCVVIDDICRSTSPREMQKRRDLTGYILRIAANETPIAKMEGGKTVNRTCVSGLVLTGELPLEVPSDVTRCIIINVNDPLRNGNPDIRIITATAVAAYIQWLCVHFTEEMGLLRCSYHTFSEKDTQKNLWRLKSLFSSWIGCLAAFYASQGVSEQLARLHNNNSKIAPAISLKVSSAMRRASCSA